MSSSYAFPPVASTNVAIADAMMNTCVLPSSTVPY
jgi:hypothetical protein